MGCGRYGILPVHLPDDDVNEVNICNQSRGSHPGSEFVHAGTRVLIGSRPDPRHNYCLLFNHDNCNCNCNLSSVSDIIIPPPSTRKGSGPKSESETAMKRPSPNYKTRRLDQYVSLIRIRDDPK